MSHTCDETKELRFPEFGDATGLWKRVEPEIKQADGREVSSFTFDKDGTLNLSMLGCSEHIYPLVLGDYNSFPELLNSSRVYLVDAKVEQDFIRLDFHLKMRGEADREEYLEFHRVGPNRIELKKRLYHGWVGKAYERDEEAELVSTARQD